MSFHHQIEVELNHPSVGLAGQVGQPSQPGNFSISIQASTGWVITGQYQNHMLQTITVQKTPKISN